MEAGHCIYRGSRDLSRKRVAVLGLARTGIATVQFLAHRGAYVVALDSQPLEALPLEAHQIRQVASQIHAPHPPLADLLPLDVLVISPGVPTLSPFVQEAVAAGVEVIGEVELAYRHCDAPMVAVTGTCGKGTTVTALGAMLGAGDIPHVVAGNIGRPLIAEMSRSADLQVVVAEISSFQLETTRYFHPHISVLLSITEDHLERYPSFDAYIEAKALVFRNQTAQDWAVFCVDDPRVRDMLGCTPAKRLTVSLRDPQAHGRVDGERLMVQLPGAAPEVVATRAELPLAGEHHVANFLAAALVARLCGAPVEALGPALRAYQPAPHLMAVVGEWGGVRYVDDSKATNPASAVADLSSVAGPVIVIAGGKEKNTDFGQFGKVLAERAKRVLLLGECAPRIAQATARPELCRRVGSMEEAVALAAAEAHPGDTVILCPGCSSLDMFASYAHRGEAFAQAVRRVAGHFGTQE